MHGVHGDGQPVGLLAVKAQQVVSEQRRGLSCIKKKVNYDYEVKLMTKSTVQNIFSMLLKHFQGNGNVEFSN